MKRTKKQKESILDEAMERFDIATDAWNDVFEEAREDVRFVDQEDAQWSDDIRGTREGRPTMTFDKVSGSVDMVIGNHLQQRPQIKVRGAEDDDADVAEIYEGLIRQIEQRGNKAYKTGFKFAVKGGYGVWRVRHDYIDEESMDQDILLCEVKNPFSVLLDPIIQVDELDTAMWGFNFLDMPKGQFEDEYPKAESTASDTLSTAGTSNSWVTEEFMRVAEYFRLVKKDRTLYRLSTGETVWADEFEPIRDELEAQQITVDRERVVEGHKLECFKMTSMEILEEIECIGKFIPLIPIFGKCSNVDGRFTTRGLIRKAKDAQRLYNYERSAYIESVALQPKQPYMVTAKMVKGHEAKWRDMNTSNDPALFYNLDEGHGPRREPPAQVSQGLLTGLQMSADDIKSATGIYDASRGARSNETSGKAIQERKMQGDTATYEFTDELVEAIQHTGRIFVDLIPQVYDATRQIRILGEDDAEMVKMINKPTRDEQSANVFTLNDLNRGQYDVKITTGPAYSTRRSETAEQLSQIMAQNPELGLLLSDEYIKSLDLVGGDEALKRVRSMMVKKGLAEPTDEEKKDAAENQKPPDPLQEAMKKIQFAMAQEELKAKQVSNEKTATDMKKTQFDMQKEAASLQKTPAEQAAAQADIAKTQSEIQLNQMKAAEIREEIELMYDPTTGGYNAVS